MSFHLSIQKPRRRHGGVYCMGSCVNSGEGVRPARHRDALGNRRFGDLLLVDERGHLEERSLLHLVAGATHKVVDRRHLGRQRTPHTVDTGNWKGAAMRVAALRRGDGDAVVGVRRQRHRCAAPLGLLLLLGPLLRRSTRTGRTTAAKGRTGDHVHAAPRLRTAVVGIVVVVWQLVIVLVVVSNRRPRALRMPTLRAHRRRAVELVARPKLQGSHRDWCKLAIRRRRPRLCLSTLDARPTATSGRPLPQRMLRRRRHRHSGRRRRRRRGVARVVVHSYPRRRRSRCPHISAARTTLVVSKRRFFRQMDKLLKTLGLV